MDEWFGLQLRAGVAKDLLGCPVDTLEITIETGGADHLPRQLGCATKVFSDVASGALAVSDDATHAKGW